LNYTRIWQIAGAGTRPASGEIIAPRLALSIRAFCDFAAVFRLGNGRQRSFLANFIAA